MMDVFRLRILALVMLGIATTAGAQPSGDKEAGRKLFSAHCTLCHGATGQGDGPAGVILDPPPRDLTIRPYKNGCGPGAIVRTVRQGIPESGMPSFQGVLSEAQMRDLAFYVRSLQAGCGHAQP